MIPREPTWTIAKTFEFSASHQLFGLEDGHKCSRLHGHNYRVTIEVTGPLDGNEMVLDYGRLDPFNDWLKGEVDHRHLNDLVDFNPTAERLAEWFYDHAERLLPPLPVGVRITATRVMETTRTSAEFRP